VVNAFDKSLVYQHTGTAHLGRGEMEIVTRIKREDGTIDEFTIHRMSILDPEDCSIKIYEEVDKTKVYSDNVIPRMPNPTAMVLELGGKLLSDGVEALYTFKTDVPARWEESEG
jgi:hypothetical protein